MSDEHRWSEDLAAYALGALEPGEAAELERHLEGCERCAAELRWLRPAVDALPAGVERLEPPPALREELITEVRADARAAAAEARPRRSERRGSRLLGGFGWRPAAALAVIALLVVAFVGYQVGEGGSGDGTSPPGGVTATMVREGESGKLELANVPEPPADEVLEAWVERDGEVEPVRGLFRPDEEGRATTTIEDMDGVETVMVTFEPKGGSEQPTSAPLVTIPVESS